MYIANVLSTVQTQSQVMKLTIDNDENHPHIGSLISSLPAWDVRLQQIMEAQEEDPVCMQIKVNCCEGRPDKYSLNAAMKLYWWSRSELSVVQNILLKASRIIIPSSMHLEVLDKIHEHQGITKMPEAGKKLCLKARTQPKNPRSGATMQNSSTPTIKLLEASLRLRVMTPTKTRHAPIEENPSAHIGMRTILGVHRG